jgi:zinc protease
LFFGEERVLDVAHWQQWRKTRPAADPSPALHLPAPAEFKLENGLEVLLVERHALPLLTAHVVSRAGSDNNGSRKSGLASLTSQLMGDRNRLPRPGSASRRSGTIGTRVSTFAGMDSGAITLSVLTSNADKAMDLLGDVA